MGPRATCLAGRSTQWMLHLLLLLWLLLNCLLQSGLLLAPYLLRLLAFSLRMDSCSCFTFSSSLVFFCLASLRALPCLLLPCLLLPCLILQSWFLRVSVIFPLSPLLLPCLLLLPFSCLLLFLPAPPSSTSTATDLGLNRDATLTHKSDRIEVEQTRSQRETPTAAQSVVS